MFRLQRNKIYFHLAQVFQLAYSPKESLIFKHCFYLLSPKQKNSTYFEIVNRHYLRKKDNSSIGSGYKKENFI